MKLLSLASSLLMALTFSSCANLSKDMTTKSESKLTQLKIHGMKFKEEYKKSLSHSIKIPDRFTAAEKKDAVFYIAFNKDESERIFNRLVITPEIFQKITKDGWHSIDCVGYVKGPFEDHWSGMSDDWKKSTPKDSEAMYLVQIAYQDSAWLFKLTAMMPDHKESISSLFSKSQDDILLSTEVNLSGWGTGPNITLAGASAAKLYGIDSKPANDVKFIKIDDFDPTSGTTNEPMSCYIYNNS